MENRKSQTSFNDLVVKTNIGHLLKKGVCSSKRTVGMLSAHASVWADGTREEGRDVYPLGPIFA